MSRMHLLISKRKSCWQIRLNRLSLWVSCSAISEFGSRVAVFVWRACTEVEVNCSVFQQITWTIEPRSGQKSSTGVSCSPWPWDLFMWCFMLLFWVKRMLHTSHLKGFLPVCLTMWTCRALFWLKALSHWVHLKGRSPAKQCTRGCHLGCLESF